MNIYKNLIFSEIIPAVVAKYASNPALGFFEEEVMTYAELEKNIQATIVYAEELGLKPQDKAIIYSQNMPNWGVVYLALQYMGVVVVPVLPDFNQYELSNVISHSEATTLFISKNLEYKLQQESKDALNSIIAIDDFSVLKGKEVQFSIEKKSTEVYSVNENDLSILIYTSGTTDNSKGVMLSQKNVIINALQSGEVQKVLPFDKFLSVLPLSHTYENTIGFILPLLKGASVTYLRKPPTANVLLPALEKLKPEFMLTVPMIIEKVFKTKVLAQINKKAITKFLYKFRVTQFLLHKIAGKKLYKTFGGNLKFFGIGGAKLDGKVERFLRDAGFPYAIGYGLTETAPLLAGSNPKRTRFQAIGKNVEGCEIKINNPDSKTGEGEIWVKGPNVMLGYFKNEALTKEVVTTDGWFKTGDLGVFDKTGYLSHKGRLKNMIVGANGENIYPEEIESLINNFKHVAESIVLQQKGKLVALVHFNREELEQKIQLIKKEITEKVDSKIEEINEKIDKTIEELTHELELYINSRVNKFSRIQALVVHNDPFQKTATQKIKRYLYS